MAKASNMAIARALHKRFQQAKSTSEVAEGLAAYLIQERRIGDLNAILRDLERLLYEKESTLYIHTTSATELTEQMAEKIKQIFSSQYSAQKMVINSEINPDVIGGVRCQTTDAVLDLTIRRQLQQLKRI